jgi:hypothetical protein
MGSLILFLPTDLLSGQIRYSNIEELPCDEDEIFYPSYVKLIFTKPGWSLGGALHLITDGWITAIGTEMSPN